MVAARVVDMAGDWEDEGVGQCLEHCELEQSFLNVFGRVKCVFYNHFLPCIVLPVDLHHLHIFTHLSYHLGLAELSPVPLSKLHVYSFHSQSV